MEEWTTKKPLIENTKALENLKYKKPHIIDFLYIITQNNTRSIPALIFFKGVLKHLLLKTRYR